MRFDPSFMNRRDVSYQNMRRLEPEELKIFEAEEKRLAEHKERIRVQLAERDAFHARPEVQAASSVLYILQDDLSKVIDKLTPEEWQALAAKLT
jgi:hypothetical protein